MPRAEYSLGLSCQFSPLPGKRYDPEQHQEPKEVKKTQKENVLPPKPRRGLVPVPSL
jgi:hypothetical protein